LELSDVQELTETIQGVLQEPNHEEIDQDTQERTIVEFYAR
jgi:hypothetical protein